MENTLAISQLIPLNGLPPEHFLVLSVGTLQDLGWEVERITKTGWTAFSHPNAVGDQIKLTLKIERFTATLQSESNNKEFANLFQTQKAMNDFIEALYKANRSYSRSGVMQYYQELEPYLSAAETPVVPAELKPHRETLNEVASLFVPKKGYFVTPLVIVLNMAVYFWTLLLSGDLLAPHFQVLLDWGGNSRARTLNGEPWRLITCCFLHADLLHIAMNMFALYVVGFYLEPYLGKLKMILAYVLCGIIASITSLSQHDKAMSVGASGAIFGLYGVFLILLLTHVADMKNRARLLPAMIGFVVFNLLPAGDAHIDFSAHLGGFACGLMTGYAYYLLLTNPQDKKRQFYIVASLCLIVFVISGWVYTHLSAA